MDRPLEEWAYVTPDRPDGISVEELKSGTVQLQRQTMFYWFVLNFVPSPDEAGQMVERRSPSIANAAFNSTVFNGQPLNGARRDNIASAIGWDTTPREPLSSHSILEIEFERVVPANVIAGMADQLPGQWVWSDGSPPAVPNISSLTNRQKIDFILARLDVLEAAFSAIAPAHGGPGHNEGPSYDPPLTVEERNDAIASVQNARAALSTSSPNWEAFDLSWATVYGLAKKVGLWVCGKADLFTEEAGKSAGKWVGPIVAFYVAAQLFQHAQRVSEVLEHLKFP